MRENKLSIRIEARAEQFHRALRKVDADSSAFAKAVERMIESSSKKASDSVGKAANDITGKLGKAGKDGASSLDQVGDGADEAARELTEMANRFAGSADKAAAAARTLSNSLDDVGDASGDIKAVRAQLEQMESELKQSAEAARSIDFSVAIESGQRLAQSVEAATEPIRDAAAETRNLERAIKRTFSNTKDQEAFRKAAEDIADTYGDIIPKDELARTAQIFGTLKAPVEDYVRAAKVAATTSRDFSDAGQDLAEVLADISSGNADLEVVNESLRSNFGIGAEALRDYGASVDSNNKLLARTKKEQLAAQKAIRAYIDTSEDYGKVSERASDNQAKLSIEVDKFNRAVGSQVNELKEYVAGGLLTLAKALNDLPDSVKVGVAGLALLAGPMAKLAALSLQVAGALRFLGVSFPAIGKGATDAASGVGGLSGKVKDLLPRLKTFATGTGGSALALGGLAIAAYQTAKASNEYGESLEQVDKAESSLIQTQAKSRREHKELNEVRKKSIDVLRDESKEIEDNTKKRILATFALADAREGLDDAERSGDKDAIAAAKQRLAEAQSFRNEVDSFHAIEIKQAKERAKAREEEFDRAKEAFNEFKIKLDAGAFESQQKALDAAKAAAQGLSGAPLEQAKAEIRKLNKAILDENLDRIDREFEAGKISAKRAKELLNTQLSVYEANLDQRRDAYQEFAEKEERVNEARLRNQQKYLQEALNAEKNSIRERASLVENTSELPALEKRLEAGENVLAQYKDEAAEQTKRLKALADEEAALDRIAIQREKAAAIKESPKDVDLIDDAAGKKLEEVNARVAAQKAKLDKDLAAASAAADEKRLKGQEAAQKKREETAKKLAETESKAAAVALQRFEEEQAQARETLELKRQALDEEENRGRDVSIQRKELAKEELEQQRANAAERLKLIEAEIEAKRKAANAGASDGDKAVNDESARLAILAAQRSEREKQREISLSNIETIRAEVEEEEKKLRALQKQNKERAKGFNTSFGASDSAVAFDESFGQSNLPSNRGAKSEDGRTADQVARDLERKQVELASAEEAAKRNPGLAGPTPVQLDPQVIGLFQQMAVGIQQSVTATNSLAQAVKAAQIRASAHNEGARFAEGGISLTRSTDRTLF